MEHVSIPDIPIKASRVGLGTWAMGGVSWGHTDDDESIRTIHSALDRGINLIDTAPAYGDGHAEEVVGRALAERGGRERLIIATKVGLEWRGNTIFRIATRERIFEEIDASLRRLQTDYLDLYQVHWPDPLVPIEETAAAMLELKQQGKIRAIGVSNYSVEEMERFRCVAPLASAQPPYNIFERTAEDIIAWCEAHGVATLAYEVLCRGLLTGQIHPDTRFAEDDLRRTDPKFQPPRFAQYLAAVQRLEEFARNRYGKSLLALAVRWALDQPGVSVVLWGTRHPNRLEPLNEVFGWRIDAAANAQIDRILSETVRDPVGPEFMAPSVRPATEAHAIF
ncbi:MAG: putative oxidoreductase [Pedosphaera sp.]|nr:putative oxidoreductase [Pedosphaera sp.]